ncbi:MAG: acyl-CoA/acyl-ACP dehydrogenase [Deltaproteobacteria bacterium]|nr:acyl-CoA/acyl-ACP dehydrogenase [Deltaproteobacteria bacterium]
MDFAFSKDQELIRSSVREFLKKECPKDSVRELKGSEKGYDPKVWKKMVKLGFQGLVIPEEYGGTEGEFYDLVIFMEEAGRNIFPSPYFSTVCLCSMPLLEYATAEQKKKYLPKIAAKGAIWSLALKEETDSYESGDIRLRADLQGDEYVLNGKKLFVPYANSADHILVVARTDDEAGEGGITVFIVDCKSAGLETEIIPTVSHDTRCEVRFNDVKVPGENILGEQGRGWQIVDYILTVGALLKSAEVSGSAQAVVDITTRYARERHQFDKPIGSFQVIQHRLVDHLCEIDGLKNLVYEAAETINSGNPSKRLCSMAKLKANQVHKGI